MSLDDNNKHLDEISLNMDIDGSEEGDKNDGTAEGNHQESVPENESASNDSQVVQSDRPVLTARMLEKKAEFERERDEVLNDVPQSAKERFGGVYFSRFGGYYGPVLVMNPYRVAPGPVRNEWLEMFHKVSASSQLIVTSTMTRIISLHLCGFVTLIERGVLSQLTHLCVTLPCSAFTASSAFNFYRSIICAWCT